MPTNVVGTKIHTHIRAVTKHGNGKPIDEVLHNTTYTPKATLDAFKEQGKFQFKRYAETYSRDFDGNTEYIIFTGTTKDDYRLTIHTWSCYCEPLNVNQEPPF